MSRKPKRGYYVKGHFVAQGSELDLELKRQAKGDTDVSKTDLKRQSERLQVLGEALLTLRSDLGARLLLPDALTEAVAQARRISDFEGRRRQMQYIGKLMRRLEEPTVLVIEAALEEQRKPSAQETLRLHQAEAWRDRLLADDSALTDWLALHPSDQGSDIQALRALIRQARKDASAGPAPAAGTTDAAGTTAATRHGRAYRDIFQWVKNALSHTDAPHNAQDPASSP